MPRDPRVEKLQRLRNERVTRATGTYYGTRATAYGNVLGGPRKRDMGRTLLSLALFVVIMAVALYGVGQWMLHGYRAPQAANQREQTVVVNIPSGAGASLVATQLYNKGLVPNATIFYVYLRYFSGATWTAGIHTLHTGMSPDEVVRAITMPALASQVKVTIRDGWRAEQVAQALAAAHVASYDDVMQVVREGNFSIYPFLRDRPVGATLEGYLYPDTYYFNTGEGAHSAIDKILSNFVTKVSTQVQAQGRKTFGTFYKAVIMASIVQREAGTADDAKLIASTLLNRLHDRSGQYPNLGADATVQYAVGHAPNWWSEPTGKDLNTAANSRFNTRVYPGLPPAPISEPNIVSIEAAVSPPSTPYFSYYHVNGSYGKSIFCTFQEGVGCKGIPQ
jgi:UPF0755 protein